MSDMPKFEMRHCECCKMARKQLEAAERERDDAKAFSVCESCKKEEPDWANPMHCHNCYMTLNLNYQNALAREAETLRQLKESEQAEKRWEDEYSGLSKREAALRALVESIVNACKPMSGATKFDIGKMADQALSASPTDHDHVLVRREALIRIADNLMCTAKCIEYRDNWLGPCNEMADASTALKAFVNGRQPRSEYYTCPVCYFSAMEGPPADYEICPCCGTEFEYDDHTVTHTELRQRWIDAGMPWLSSEPPPENWNLVEQLKGIPRSEEKS